MPLTPGFADVYDLFEKLKRDAALLDEEVTRDRFFNFAVTGWSMVDWVRYDNSLPAHLRNAASINRIYSDNWIKICGDIANSLKHFELDRREPITRSATSSSGYGLGRYGKGPFGIGEESIEIVLNDGTRYKSAEFVDAVVSFWRTFLADPSRPTSD